MDNELLRCLPVVASNVWVFLIWIGGIGLGLAGVLFLTMTVVTCIDWLQTKWRKS